jgi:hypothetical protein
VVFFIVQTKLSTAVGLSRLEKTMSSGADISTLYREFTQALTDVWPNTPLVRHLVVGSPRLALLSKSIRNTASMDIF